MIAIWLTVGLLASPSAEAPPVVGGTFEEAQQQYERQRRRSIDDLVESLEPERQAKRANKKKVVTERYPAAPIQTVEIPAAGEIDLSAIKQAGDEAERALLVSGQIRTTVVQAVEDEAAVALLMMLLEGR